MKSNKKNRNGRCRTHLIEPGEAGEMTEAAEVGLVIGDPTGENPWFSKRGDRPTSATVFQVILVLALKTFRN